MSPGPSPGKRWQPSAAGRECAGRRPAPETLRRLVHAVLDHHGGRLQDDATVLLCEWLGSRPEAIGPAAARVGLNTA